MGDSWLHRWAAAGDSGDVDAFDELLHPDVLLHAPLGLSTNDREAEKAVWRDAKSAIPDIRHDVQEVFCDDDTLIGRVVVTGTLEGDFAGLPGNGRRFEIDQVLIAKVRDGKAYEVWEIADTGSLMRQVNECGVRRYRSGVAVRRCVRWLRVHVRTRGRGPRGRARVRSRSSLGRHP